MARCCTLLLLALAAATAVAAQAADPALTKDLSEGLTRCLLTPEALAKADYTEIKATCDPSVPVKQRCEKCACALVDSLVETLEREGYKVDLGAISQADATIAVQQCFQDILPALTDAGVDLGALMALTTECTDTPACLSVGSD